MVDSALYIEGYRVDHVQYMGEIQVRQPTVYDKVTVYDVRGIQD